MSVTFNGKREQGINEERYEFGDDAPYLNLSNTNAAAFLRFLGLEKLLDEYMCGEVSIPEARRAVIKARATFERKVKDHVRLEERSGHLVDGNGTTHLHRPRFISAGIDAEYFKFRLNEFANMIEWFATRGATHIHWG